MDQKTLENDIDLNDEFRQMMAIQTVPHLGMGALNIASAFTIELLSEYAENSYLRDFASYGGNDGHVPMTETTDHVVTDAPKFER